MNLNGMEQYIKRKKSLENILKYKNQKVVIGALEILYKYGKNIKYENNEFIFDKLSTESIEDLIERTAKILDRGFIKPADMEITLYIIAIALKYNLKLTNLNKFYNFLFWYYNTLKKVKVNNKIFKYMYTYLAEEKNPYFFYAYGAHIENTIKMFEEPLINNKKLIEKGKKNFLNLLESKEMLDTISYTGLLCKDINGYIIKCDFKKEIYNKLVELYVKYNLDRDLFSWAFYLNKDILTKENKRNVANEIISKLKEDPTLKLWIPCYNERELTNIFFDYVCNDMYFGTDWKFLIKIAEKRGIKNIEDYLCYKTYAIEDLLDI